ncbi:MAG: nucleotidyltransferase [Mucilaginibacter sp.]|nr:nucleotidyltransferase [Mucilaginibacter sp.]
MARTIEEVYQTIITQKNNTAELGALNSTSKTAVYNLMCYVIAVVIVALENLFDLHKSENDAIIATLKPHTARWYRDKALNFQFGQDLTEGGIYANVGLTSQNIAAQKIIAQAAVTEVDGRLRIKVTKASGDDLVALSALQLTAFVAYMNKIKDAGVKVINDSLAADALKLTLDIWYNPLVLTSTGARIDGSSTEPVKSAIKAYLKNTPFNGEFSNTKLTDELQKIDGVVFPVIKLSQAKYGLFPFSGIDEKYVPDAGYLRIADADLTINYRQYVQS